MTESPAGSGHYVGSVPAVYPHHGLGTFVVSISCQSPLEFNIYIDPSGIVKDTHGNPVPGATATLFRSETGAAASFTSVPSGSAIMSPSNRTNPDVTAGYYFVRTQKQGCSNPNDRTQAYVDSPVVTIPPAVTDLDLVLDCDHPTAVRLRSFSARRNADGSLVLRWRTGSEADVLGFNVFRQRGNTRTRLNRSTIAARGGGGSAYALRVRRASATGFYWLQIVRVSGARSWYGPASR